MAQPQLLIPVKKLALTGGHFTWPARATLSSPSTADERPLRQLACDLQSRLGLRPRVRSPDGHPATLRCVRVWRTGHPEGYRLLVTTQDIEIQAATEAGAFYALQTLRELVAVHGRRLPACRIDDAPDFPRRGVYLDCSRGKVPTLDTLKQLVEHLAAWKVNEFQLYIENVFAFRQHPDIARGFSPFTPVELVALQRFAREHHIALVPSLSSFGHFERILGLPAYRALGEMPGHLGYPGGTTLCPTDPRSIRLIAELYNEFLPLFEAADFNVCCDETWELGRGRSKHRADRQGVGAVYLEFVKKIHRLCRQHGRRMNMWADIVLRYPELVKEVPEDTVLLNWDYAPKGARIARCRDLAETGRAFLVCPGTSGWRSHGTRLDHAMQNVRVFARAGRRHGAAGLLNTDWGDYGHRNPLGSSLHGMAHGAAHAWHGAAVDEATFTDRFVFHFLGADTKRVAETIRTIGASERHAGGCLYMAHSESIAPDKHLFQGLTPRTPVWIPPANRRDHLGNLSLVGSRRLFDQLTDLLRHPPRASKTTPFAAQALEDLVLAAELDLLAVRKGLLTRRYRSHRPIPPQQWKRLYDATMGLAEAFEANWRVRYKPSRLRDNLRLFRNAAQEYASHF